MPSPIGHALAGLAIGWTAEAVRRSPMGFRAGSSLAVTCAALAVCPDLDWIYPPIHRMMTHSLVATAGILAILWVVSRRKDFDPAWPVAIACGLAYASHLLLDFLGGDTKLPAGIQLLWPFSDAWFISTWSLFPATDIGGFFRPRIMLSNALAVLAEIVLLAPLAYAAWLWQRRRLTARTHTAEGRRPQPWLPEESRR